MPSIERTPIDPHDLTLSIDPDNLARLMAGDTLTLEAWSPNDPHGTPAALVRVTLTERSPFGIYARAAALATEENVPGVRADGRTYLAGYVYELEGDTRMVIMDPLSTAREFASTVTHGWAVQVWDNETGDTIATHTGMREPQALDLVRALIRENRTVRLVAGEED